MKGKRADNKKHSIRQSLFRLLFDCVSIALPRRYNLFDWKLIESNNIIQALQCIIEAVSWV